MTHSSDTMVFAKTSTYQEPLWVITNILHRKSEKRYLFCSQNCTITFIANIIGRNKSTISRELKRNAVDSKYSAVAAQAAYEQRQRNCHPKKKLADPVSYHPLLAGLVCSWPAPWWTTTSSSPVCNQPPHTRSAWTPLCWWLPTPLVVWWQKLFRPSQLLSLRPQWTAPGRNRRLPPCPLNTVQGCWLFCACGCTYSHWWWRTNHLGRLQLTYRHSSHYNWRVL